MRSLQIEDLYPTLKKSIIQAGISLPQDIVSVLDNARAEAEGPALSVLNHIKENLEIAEEKQIPLCQDTGMVILFVSIGKQVIMEGGDLEEILHRAVCDAYEEGYFRKSVVMDPLKDRKNSGNNLPPLIHYDFIEGDELFVQGLLKGFGSENCSRTFMLKPTDGRQKVIDEVVAAVTSAGGAPCPPVVLGLGIGGTMDYAAKLSKIALLRDMDQKHPDPYYAELEKDLYDNINATNIGAGGLGGSVTTLGVKVETAATHIAGMPVALSVNCWADRKFKVKL